MMNLGLCRGAFAFKKLPQRLSFSTQSYQNTCPIHRHPSCRLKLLEQPLVAGIKIPSRSNTQHRVIMLPEYPGQSSINNPLLKNHKDGLPDYKSVSEEHCYYGLGQVLMEFESSVCRVEKMIENGETNWESLLTELEHASLALENVISSANLMNIVTDKLDIDRFTQLSRRAERALLSRFDNRTVHTYLTGDKVEGVEGEDSRVLDRYVTEYKHQGYELSEKKYMELNTNWMKRLGEAQRDHRFKTTTASQRFRHVIRDPAVVREFPVDLLRAMSMDSSQPAKGPWSVTLHPYTYRKFLEYCPERRLRWNAYNARTSIGSPTMDVYLNVSGHVKDIRQYKLDQAITLGYYNYAEMSMVTKMASSVDNVNSMIASMLGVARPIQEEEVAKLQNYAESRGFEDTIREFDVPFFRRKQARTVYGVEDESLRDYFPLPNVLNGLFSLLNEQFGVQFTIVDPATVDGTAWTDEVSTYRVTEGDRLLGHCYLDPYIRDDKAYQGGDKGWFIPIRSNSAVGQGVPLGALVMALSTPGYGKPSLLSFPEVIELTRQVGKAVQHLLAANKWSETSGRLGVEWDALNIVPDFLTHWLSVPGVVSGLSSHWSNGSSLTQDQTANLIASQNHMAGFDLCQELYKAAFDMAFYTEDYEDEQYQTLAERLAAQYLVLPREKEDAFPLYFDDMLTGHWAAGYYSHLWSRMLAADLFSAYLEVGLENADEIKNLSSRFKTSFLCAGSARPTAQLFREFRGRDPTPEALLLSLGLQDNIAPKSRIAKT